MRVLEERNDEWAVGHRYFSAESMKKLYHRTTDFMRLLLVCSSRLRLSRLVCNPFAEVVWALAG